MFWEFVAEHTKYILFEYREKFLPEAVRLECSTKLLLPGALPAVFLSGKAQDNCDLFGIWLFLGSDVLGFGGVGLQFASTTGFGFVVEGNGRTGCVLLALECSASFFIIVFGSATKEPSGSTEDKISHTLPKCAMYHLNLLPRTEGKC